MATVAKSSLATTKVSAILRADDYDRVKRFYEDKLGLEVKDTPGPTRQGEVDAGDGTSFIVYERPGMPAPPSTAIGFLVPDVEASVRELQGRGVVFEEYDLPDIGLKTVNGIAKSDGAMAAWFKDSEGNIFAVYPQ